MFHNIFGIGEKIENIFGIGEKIENYILDELSPRIKVKKKYQKKLFLYLGNLFFTRL